MAEGSITDITGILVGHWSDREAATGCTVVLCGPVGAVGGVAVRGGAPGTRETDLLRPGNLVERVHAVLLSGGSAFGLDAAGGVMRFLEERGVGFSTPTGPVPIVPAAVLYDLAMGRADVRPGADAGYSACTAAAARVAEGSTGAGTGASVAKLWGPTAIRKGGIGTASVRLTDGRTVGALVAVNAVGAVYDVDGGGWIAAPGGERSTERLFRGGNTTIGVVATDAPLDKAGAQRLASIGHDGLALAIRPAHTAFDGDTLFALSLAPSEADEADPVELSAAVVTAVARAIRRGVALAEPLAAVSAAANA